MTRFECFLIPDVIMTAEEELIIEGSATSRPLLIFTSILFTDAINYEK